MKSDEIKALVNHADYYNRFEKEKNWDYLAVLAGRAIQSAEANEMQHVLEEKVKALGSAIYVDGTVIDREGRSLVCPVRVLSPEANRLRREARLIEHLTRSGVLHGGRIGNTRLRWIRAQDHSRESRRLVEAGGHFFDVPKAAAAA